MSETIRSEPLPADDTIHIRACLPRNGFELDVDLRLPAQGVTVIFGHSGSGKTSLLRVLAGLEKAASAQLSIDGDSWQSPKHFVPTHKRKLAYVFQEASLFVHLTVQQNLDYGRRRNPSRTITTTDDVGQHIVKLLNIQSLLERYPAALSGGERQRVAIARALLSQPQLLLMDEPLASLDFARKQEILRYLERIRAELNIPIIYVTHSADELVRLADHLVVLERGRVCAQGRLAEVLADQGVMAGISAEPFSLWQGQVVARPSDERLTEVDVDGLCLRLAKQQGHNIDVRLRLYAKDISLSLTAATDSSILNVLPCVIRDIDNTCAQGQRLISLACGSQTLLARLTDFSCEQLGLHDGLALFAQIKAVSVVQ